MRITIIGLPGSGKSTLARMIAEKLSIPHIHIDRFWFEAGGRNGSHDTPNIEQVRAHIKEKVLIAVSAESWVSDGFYSRIQSEVANRADVVIFLDIPLWRRLLNHASRMLQPGSRHAEVSTWDDLRFFSEIIRRTFTNVFKIKQFLAQYKEKTITLRSRKEIAKYLENLRPINMPLTFVRATSFDVDTYLSLEKKVMGTPTYSGIADREEALEEIRNEIVYLIQKDDVVVGSIQYHIKENGTAYISGLVIDPAYQGQGIAREAMNRILAEVADAPRIELVTHPDNVRALKLYESLGFKIESRNENYYGDGQPRVLLARTRI